MKITIKKASIINEPVDAIVNPANSYGYMGGGVAGVIKKIGGSSIEDEAIAQAPINIGEAVVTKAGELQCRHIIHAPTMENPGEKTDTHKIKCATEAALEAAERNGFKKIAIPGMGTGVGGVSKELAAKTMMQAIKKHKPETLEEIRLVDIDDAMVETWQKHK